MWGLAHYQFGVKGCNVDAICIYPSLNLLALKDNEKVSISIKKKFKNFCAQIHILFSVSYECSMFGSFYHNNRISK